MRAADGLEKATRRNAEMLKPHKAELLGQEFDDGTGEVRWHPLAMASRLILSPRHAAGLMARLVRCFDKERSRVIRVMALQAAFNLAQRHPELGEACGRMLWQAGESNSASIRARAKLLIRRGASAP